MPELYLGIDLGTSGIRCAVIDKDHDVIAITRSAYPDDTALGWWHAVSDGLHAMRDAIGDRMGEIKAAAIDGTSGTMVLVDGQLNPVTDPLMYNSAGFTAEADVIATQAPPGHIAQGSASGLARLLRLQSMDKDQAATHLCHQADFILAKLRGKAGASDHNNCLKTGYDPQTLSWPEWVDKVGVRTALLPEVHTVGAVVGTINASTAANFGLSGDMVLKAGTTDSIAAFLATGASKVGEAVTSLGTTLAIKMVSRVRIDDANRGIYSHRLGDQWLVGGASNTGGGALLVHFTLEEINTLSAQIDPTKPTHLAFYPLARPGERFPICDPNFQPIDSPRPAEDFRFLQGLLESIARIEADCYALLAEKGAPMVSALFTAGGGGASTVWTEIRKSIVTPNIQTARHSEAAIGSAILSTWRL